MFWQGRDLTTELVSPGGGGARIVRDPTLLSVPFVYEAGISTAQGGGNAPNANSVWRAFNMWNNRMSMREDTLVIRVHGRVTPYDRYLRPGESLDTVRSRRVGRWETMEVLRSMRGDTGDGFGNRGSTVSQQFAGDYPNVFLRVMSELTGHTFDEIETVQFY